MCGVAGVLSLRGDLVPPPREACARMIGALRHRGPDEAGLYRDARCALGHARLSIVDLAGGSQPLSNEDGSIWISFNGEIFNHVELRAELEPLGHAFRTRSDTEVIVHAWEQWGEDAFARFNGQFAIALWDAARGRLVLARDPLGVRPLYTCAHGGRLWFASEVKAIFAGDPSIPRRLDPAGLGETFTFWTVVPPQSVFEGIRELPPGHLEVWEDGRSRERCFWRPSFPTCAEGAFRGTVREAAARVREELRRAVELRVVRSDVPVGSYLSGGLDSSLVAALGRRVAGERFRTFSLRFEDPEYDETPWQRAVARRLESEHAEVLVRRAAVAAALSDVVWHAERPILRTAPVPLFLLSRLVREAGVKVVLTGEGADETFAGYDLFREAKVRRFWGRRPDSALRPLLLRRLYPWLARSPVAQRAMAEEFFGRGRERWREPGFAHEPRWRSTAALWRLFAADVRDAVARLDPVARLLARLPPEHARWTELARDQDLEIRTLLSGYLLSSQGDRMLMAHSVEGRFPFLDPNVVALAASLPPSHKLRGLEEKHVLKRASEGLVPPEIVRRTKQPYRAPDALAFAGDGAPEWVHDAMGDRAVRDAGVFDPAQVARLARKCRESEGGQFSNADNMAVVGVLSTQLLHARLVRAAPAPAAAIELRTVVDRLAPDGAGKGSP